MKSSGSGAIRLRDLYVGYGRVPVLAGLNGDFESGSLTALIGPNGAGKSTLLMTIAGLLPPLKGSLVVAAKDRGEIAFLPQYAAIERDFPITAFDFVAAGLFRSIGSFRAPDSVAKRQIHAALETVGIADCAERLIGHLSGGQLQRALFARLIMQDAQTILMDEPFTAIDTETVEILLGLLQDWHQQGRTIIASLHDLELVQRHFPYTFRIGKTGYDWGPTARLHTIPHAEDRKTRPELRM